MAPCCLGTASPHDKQMSLVGLGCIHAKVVPPTQTFLQRDPAVHPQSFREGPLALWGSPCCLHSPLWLGVLSLGRKGGAQVVLAVHNLVILSAPD